MSGEMKNNESSKNPAEPEKPMGAQGIIFAVVGAGSGIFTATRLASILPIWAAILVTFGLWILLVGSSMAVYGAELPDIVVGSIVIVFVMMLLVPGAAWGGNENTRMLTHPQWY